MHETDEKLRKERQERREGYIGYELPVIEETLLERLRSALNDGIVGGTGVYPRVSFPRGYLAVTSPS